MNKISMQYPFIDGNIICDGQMHNIKPISISSIENDLFILTYYDETYRTRCITVLRRDNRGNFYKVPLRNYDQLFELINARVINQTDEDISILDNINVIFCDPMIVEDLNAYISERIRNISVKQPQSAPTVTVGAPPPPPPEHPNTNNPYMPSNTRFRYRIIPENRTQTQIQIQSVIIVYYDDIGNYYLDEATALRIFGVTCRDYYYRLTTEQYNYLKRKYKIEYRELIYTKKPKESIIVYYDDMGNYYLDETTALRIFGVTCRNYYLLTDEQLEFIKENYGIEYRRLPNLNLHTNNNNNDISNHSYPTNNNQKNIIYVAIPLAESEELHDGICTQSNIYAGLHGYCKSIKGYQNIGDTSRIVINYLDTLTKKGNIPIKLIPPITLGNATYEFVGSYGLYANITDNVIPLNSKQNDDKQQLSDALLGHTDSICNGCIILDNEVLTTYNIKTIKEKIRSKKI